jgi:hypothetical protein
MEREKQERETMAATMAAKTPVATPVGASGAV